MTNKPTEGLRKSKAWVTRRRLLYALVIVGLLHLASVPAWVRGYWAPRSALMRLLYQCLGSQEDEQARWNPDIVVVSACEKPILTAISPAQTRIGVWARARDEDWVVDAQTGHVLLAVPHSGLGFVDFVGESLAVHMWHRGNLPQVISSIHDIQTGEVFESTRIAFQSPDLDDLRELYKESNGNAVQFDGSHFRGLLFYTTAGLQVRNFQSTIPESVQELVDSWGIAKVRSRLVEAVTTTITRGDDNCLIGIEIDNSANPIFYFPSICFASVAEPISRSP